MCKVSYQLLRFTTTSSQLFTYTGNTPLLEPPNNRCIPDFVVLDFETNGFDPQPETILEIGAVRLNDRRVEQEWSELVELGGRVPKFITQLSGICNQMVAQAPPMSAVHATTLGFLLIHRLPP